MLFVGDDWAEDHHDVEVQDEAGRKLAGRRLPEGVAGVGLLHALIAEHLPAGEGPEAVVVGIETDRGMWVAALVAAGYSVFAINPLSASRYRDRHVTSRAKSDPGDAHVLADLVRTDRHQHRPVAGDSELAGSVKVLARAHQNLIWSRQQQVNALRSTLREFYPAALEVFPDLAHRDALAVLAAAPTPTAGRALRAGKVARLLRAAGRQRNIETRAEQIVGGLRAEQIVAGLRAEQLAMGPLIEAAMGASVAALIGVISAMVTQARALEQQLAASFEQHPSAEILRSLPGLGTVLGARVLAEFGDDPLRYADAKARRNYAGTSPITRASGRSWVALARVARNRRLAPPPTGGRSPRSALHPGRGPTTTPVGPAARATAPPCVRSPTASSASSTAASAPAAATTSPPPGPTSPPPPHPPRRAANPARLDTLRSWDVYLRAP